MKCSLCGLEEWTNPLVWKVRLNVKALSGNELGANTARGAGFKYRAVRRRFSSELSQHNVPKANVLRRLLLVRRYRDRCRPFDFGNLAWGFKPLIDEIVKAGWLVDDSPQWVQDIYRQLPSGTTQDYIEIELSEQS